MRNLTSSSPAISDCSVKSKVLQEQLSDMYYNIIYQKNNNNGGYIIQYQTRKLIRLQKHYILKIYQ